MTEHWWRQRFPDGTMAQNKEYYLQGIVYCLGVKGSQRELSFALLTEELKDVCFNPLSMGEGLG